MIFRLVNVIWFTAIVCLFSYIFSKGNGFAEANFEQILKDLKRIWAAGMGLCNISLNALRGHKSTTVNTISHDVLVWVQST